MLVLARPDISISLRFLIVAMVLVAGVLGLAACVDSACAECAHVCCSGADRSRPMTRLGRKLCGVCAAAASLALALFAFVSSGVGLVVASFLPTPALLRASSLRI